MKPYFLTYNTNLDKSLQEYKTLHLLYVVEIYATLLLNKYSKKLEHLLQQCNTPFHKYKKIEIIYE